MMQKSYFKIKYTQSKQEADMEIVQDCAPQATLSQYYNYQFVENWLGYQFVGYQFVGYQFVGYQ